MIGTPLFVLNETRFEITLLKTAGGESLNRNLPRTGKPGIMVSPGDLVRMDPEVIIISGFLSSAFEDSYAVFRKLGIDVSAVKNKQIFQMPPLWDFGNPRFVLGLAYLTDVLHPGEVQTGVRTETEEFYQRWYRMSYEDARPNRSFFRPSSGAKECIIRVSSVRTPLSSSIQPSGQYQERITRHQFPWYTCCTVLLLTHLVLSEGKREVDPLPCGIWR